MIPPTRDTVAQGKKGGLNFLFAIQADRRAFPLLGLEESTSAHKYDMRRIKGSVGIDANRTTQLVCKTDRALF